MLKSNNIKLFLNKFFHQPYNISAFGNLPDFINTSLYFVDFNKQKIFLKDPVVNALSELYPISRNCNIKIKNTGHYNSEISLNDGVPFHILYSIVDYLNTNNNYPSLVPKNNLENLFFTIDLSNYNNYWIKNIPLTLIKDIIYSYVKKFKVKEIYTTRPLEYDFNYYGLYSAHIDKGKNIHVNNANCPVEQYLGTQEFLESKYIFNKQKYILSGNIPYYNSRYLVDKISQKNLLYSYKCFK
jgi:hypothetical protein